MGATRYGLLLRGINVGGTRRVPMAPLRALLTDAGFAAVATHLQSGNVALTADAGPDDVARRVATLIGERFGLEVPVTARTAAELDAVIAHDPVEGAAADPQRYQVTFLGQPVDAAAIDRLRERVRGAEQLAVDGREIYTWYPDGIAGSRLAVALAHPSLGATATSRNWSTVAALARLAG